MGVGGLLSYILEHQQECCEEFDLVEVARVRTSIEILVDYYSFQQMLMEKFWQGLSLFRQNPYLRLIGAEYSTIDAFVTKLVKDLQSLGIRLVFFIDGSKGSSPSATEQKLSTWISRFNQDSARQRELIDVCRCLRSIEEVPSSTSVRPVLLEVQILKTLRRCECEVVQCVSGEADFAIAKALTDRNQAFAVLSNDSDFSIFKGCSFIPHALFDLSNDLQLGEPSCRTEKPLRLRVGVISADKVQRQLQLRDHSQLVELSIVGGNDFTEQFMRARGKEQLLCKLDIVGRPQIANIADWVRRYQRIENHSLLSQQMHRDPKFRGAVEHSRRFYNLTDAGEELLRKGPITNLLADGIQQGKFPANLMSMHYNFYWQRALLEDNTLGCPCVEIVLAELRSCIYRMVLSHKENSVQEYGGTTHGKLLQARVFAADRWLNIPSLTYIKPDKVFQNLRFFHQILSHQEPGRELNYFERYGRRNGFICYVLRYFLIMNWGRNLYLSENEFLALLAMAFCRPSEEAYQSVALQPTVRCLSVANWFQDLYRHAYLFLGHLLNIAHEFPEPREIFCSSAWVAFHASADDESRYRACQQARKQDLARAQADLNRIIREKRHVISNIVDGIFPFETRW